MFIRFFNYSTLNLILNNNCKYVNGNLRLSSWDPGIITEHNPTRTRRLIHTHTHDTHVLLLPNTKYCLPTGLCIQTKSNAIRAPTELHCCGFVIEERKFNDHSRKYIVNTFIGWCAHSVDVWTLHPTHLLVRGNAPLNICYRIISEVLHVLSSSSKA